VDISADDALSANEFASAGEDVRRGAAESEDFLQTILAAGALAVRKIKGQAEEAGLSWASVKRAKHSLGIKAGRKGGAAATGWWEWALPNAKGLNSAYEAQDLNVSPLDENEPLRT
jgi:putative DNA primase/helicase